MPRGTKQLEEVKSSAYPSLERKPGKQNWVDKAGGLPSYIERIAKHLHYEKGKSISAAIATAVNTVKKWCSTGQNHNGGKLSAKTKALACKAVGSWTAKKAGTKKGREIAEALRAEEIMSPQEQDEFAKALAGRLSICEGLMMSLTTETKGSVANARALLEAQDNSITLTLDSAKADPREISETRDRLRTEVEELAALVEAFGGRSDDWWIFAEEFGLQEAAPRGGKGGKGTAQTKEPSKPKAPPGDAMQNGSAESGRVSALQRRMSSLGHELKDDGQFGSQTDGQVRDFQRQAGLTEDGTVGPLTTEALRNAPTPDELEQADVEATAMMEKRKAEGAAKEDEPDPATTTDAGQGEEPGGGMPGGAEPVKKPPPPMIYKGMGVAGSKNEHVKDVQAHLEDAGYGLEVDGVFGPQTDRAVKRFQGKWGLRADGLVGSKTQKVLKGAAKKKAELTEATAARKTAYEGGNSDEFFRARGRESALRRQLEEGRLDEASVRGMARKTRDVLEIKRMPNGEFAPKGQGNVLRGLRLVKGGQKLRVPHRSKPGKFVDAEVPPRTSPYRDKGTLWHADVELKSGPDKGQKIKVRADDPDWDEDPHSGERNKGKPKSPGGKSSETDTVGGLTAFIQRKKAGPTTGPDRDAVDNAQASLAKMKGAPPEPKKGTPEAKASQKRHEQLNVERYGKKDAHKPKSPGGSVDHPLDATRRKGAGQKAYAETLQKDKSFEKAAAAQKKAEGDWKPPPRSPGGKVGGAKEPKKDSPEEKDRAARKQYVEGTSAKLGHDKEMVERRKRHFGVDTPKSPGGAVGGGGLQPNDEGKSLKDFPLGTTFTLPNGQEYVLHKAVGDPWMIMKPTDGGKAKPIHKMLAPPQADISTAYDPLEAGGGAPDPANPEGVTVTSGPLSQGSLSDSPGRGPTGKLRNFKAMNTPKLKGVIEELEQHGGDPEALETAKQAAYGKGWQPDLEAETEQQVTQPAAAKKNFDAMVEKGKSATKPDGTPKKSAAPAPGATGEGDLLGQLEKSVDAAKKGTLPKGAAAGAKPKAKKATKKSVADEGSDAALGDAVKKVPAGGYSALDSDPAGEAALSKLDAATPEQRKAAFQGADTAALAKLYLTAEDANFHTMNKDVEAELTARGHEYGEYEGLASGAGKKGPKGHPVGSAQDEESLATLHDPGEAELAALKAYQASGGTDPAVIEQLTPKPASSDAGNAALAAYQAAGGKDPAVIEMLKKAT